MKVKVQKNRPWLKAVQVLIALLLAAAALLLLWRPVSRLVYRKFYAFAATGIRIPGLDDALVPQGIWMDGGDTLVCGSVEGEGAYIYTVKADGSVKKCFLTDGAQPIRNHVCGLAVLEDTVIVTAEDKVFAFSLDRIRTASSADAVRSFALAQHASFVNVDGDVYIGEIHYSPHYVCEHTHTSADGDVTNAVLCRYDGAAFLAAIRDENAPVPEPAAMYTLPDKVQGCVVKDGLLLTVSSWGLAPSEYQVWALPQEATGEMNGVPLYELDRSTLRKSFTGPLMAEEMALSDGTVYVMHESAASKYMIGRLLGYTRVFVMPWSEITAP